MDLRYTVLALANLLAGAFLVTATYAFEPSTTVAVGFGVSIGVILIGLAMAYFGYIGPTRPDEKLGLGLLGLLTAALAAWTVIATAARSLTTPRAGSCSPAASGTWPWRSPG
jgi:hypothetical protein